MAHFAQLDGNNVVLQVLVVSNDVVQNLPFPESEPVGQAFCQSLLGPDTVWKQTSYNNQFRKCYAGIGFIYDLVQDVFYPPEPLAKEGVQWVWDEERWSWVGIIEE